MLHNYVQLGRWTLRPRRISGWALSGKKSFTWSTMPGYTEVGMLQLNPYSTKVYRHNPPFTIWGTTTTACFCFNHCRSGCLHSVLKAGTAADKCLRYGTAKSIGRSPCVDPSTLVSCTQLHLDYLASRIPVCMDIKIIDWYMGKINSLHGETIFIHTARHFIETEVTPTLGRRANY